MKGDCNRIDKFFAIDTDHRPRSIVGTPAKQDSARSVQRPADEERHSGEPIHAGIEMESLSGEQQELADILDWYLQQLENGTPVAVDDVVGRYPKYEQPLREYLGGLQLLNSGIGEPSRLLGMQDQKQLGDFELVREIGRGGMGVVYEARQVSLDRRVAVKVLPFAATLDKRQIVRFETEARAAARLQHPHIVPVYAVGEDNGVHFFAMQFIDGVSVRELIDRAAGTTTPDHVKATIGLLDEGLLDEGLLDEGLLDEGLLDEGLLDEGLSDEGLSDEGLSDEGSTPASLASMQFHEASANSSSLPCEMRGGFVGLGQSSSEHPAITPRFVASLGRQAAGALQAAHESHIIHRDIKPSNMLLDGQQDLWIADFGLARFQVDSQVTRSGDILGTLHYMSPEQAVGNSSVADPRSDIYSLGVTLYELLTAKRPFDGDSHADVLRQIELGHYASIRSQNAQVPRELENVVAKAMSVDPADRYPTARELQLDLERFLDGRATLAKPPSVVQQLGRWAARNRALVAAAMLVLLVVCISLSCSTFLLSRERATLAAKLTQTESTFESFGLATAERLKHIPGSETARQELLADLLHHYEELLEPSENDPALRKDRAIIRTKIANVCRESGDLSRALAAYRDAEADFLDLLGMQGAGLSSENLPNHLPEQRPITIQLAKCLSNKSVVLLELGDAREAAKSAQQAIELQTRLVKKSSQSPQLLLDLAASYANLSSISDQRNGSGIGELKRAAVLAEQARDQSNSGKQQDALSTLVVIYGQLSEQLRNEDSDSATHFAEHAVGCSNALMESYVGLPPKSQRESHATTCNNLASFYAGQGRLQEAIVLFKAAADEQEQIHARESLVLTLSNLAKLQMQGKRTEEAWQTYHKAITVQSALLLKSPGNLNQVSCLGALYNNYAYALQSQGKRENACVAYESAIEYQDRAYQLAPKHQTYYRDALSRTLFNAAETCTSLGRVERAAGLHMRRAKLWPNDARQLLSSAMKISELIDQLPKQLRSRRTWKKRATQILRLVVECDDHHRFARQVSQTKKLLAAL